MTGGTPRFLREVCDATMTLCSHRSRDVRLAATTLLPALAAFCPDAFARTHLDDAVEVRDRA